MLTNLLLLDIETVPAHRSYDSLNTNWQSLWWDKISKTVPENISPDESYRMKAGILAEFGFAVSLVDLNVTQLEKAGMLQTLNKPETIKTISGKAITTVLLPRQGVSLLKLDW